MPVCLQIILRLMEFERIGPTLFPEDGDSDCNEEVFMKARPTVMPTLAVHHRQTV